MSTQSVPVSEPLCLHGSNGPAMDAGELVVSPFHNSDNDTPERETSSSPQYRNADKLGTDSRSTFCTVIVVV